MIIPYAKMTKNAAAPMAATDGAAGFDLRATEGVVLFPGMWAAIGTGIAASIPECHAGLVCPRSGLAAKHGITVLNSPGVIDPDYRGEIKVLLINLSDELYEVHEGDRIAQLLVVPVARPDFSEVHVVSDLAQTQRGEGGFGSTGTA